VKRLHLAAATAVAGCILSFSLVPSGVGSGVAGYAHITLFLHAVAYFGFAAVLSLHFHETEAGLSEAAAISFLFGLAVELAQIPVQGRFATFPDVAANAVGASAVVLDTRVGLVSEVIDLERAVVEAFENLVSP
jgi:hypothetical protein